MPITEQIPKTEFIEKQLSHRSTEQLQRVGSSPQRGTLADHDQSVAHEALLARSRPTNVLHQCPEGLETALSTDNLFLSSSGTQTASSSATVATQAAISSTNLFSVFFLKKISSQQLMTKELIPPKHFLHFALLILLRNKRKSAIKQEELKVQHLKKIAHIFFD